MEIWLASAAIFSMVTCVIHVIVGGRFVAQPLLQAGELGTVAKYTNYYCWHLVTIAIAAMAAAYAYSAAYGARELAAFASLEALAFAAWNLGLILKNGLSFIRFPQWGLFLLIAGAGAAGLS
jgi:hypothetical protein